MSSVWKALSIILAFYCAALTWVVVRISARVEALSKYPHSMMDEGGVWLLIAPALGVVLYLLSRIKIVRMLFAAPTESSRTTAADDPGES